MARRVTPTIRAIFLILPVVASLHGCAHTTQRFGRTIVCGTDNVYRRQRTSSPWTKSGTGWTFDGSAVVALLDTPNRPHRVIGTILGYQDANWTEEMLWQSLRVRAAELGADGILFVDRRVTVCESPARASTFASSTAYEDRAGGVATGPTRYECVQILVDALVWDGELTCATEGGLAPIYWTLVYADSRTSFARLIALLFSNSAGLR